MTIVSTTVGKNSIERSSPHSEESPKSIVGCNLKNNRMISVPLQVNITVTQVYAPAMNPEES